MYTFVTVIYVMVCLALVGIVLLQQGKGADMGAAFGGSSQTFFGGSGAATMLGKLTAGAALLFMVCALSLSMMQLAESRGSGIIDFEEAPAQSAPAPVAPPPMNTAAPAPAPAAPADGQQAK